MKSPSGSAAELILPSVSYKMYLFLSCFAFFNHFSPFWSFPSQNFHDRICGLSFASLMTDNTWSSLPHQPQATLQRRWQAPGSNPPPYTSHTHVHIMLYYTMLMYTERMTNSSSALKTWELFPINHSIMILNSSGIPVSCWKFKQVKKQY